MKTLMNQVEDYMQFRVARGLVPSPKIAGLLKQFVSFLPEGGGQDPIFTTADVLAWVNEPLDAHPSWVSARLSIVRQFAKYLAGSGMEVEVPPTRLVPTGKKRAVPYIYGDEDISSLLAGAYKLRHPLRAASMATLIGLLHVTGMRVGEALSLDVEDFNPTQGTLTIRNAKFGRERIVVLHETTCAAMTGYLQDPSREKFGTRLNTPLLLNTQGRRLSYETVCDAWSRIKKGVDLPQRPGARPRLHDLRHTFATNVMVRAYEQGDNTNQTLSALSIWLGHSSPVYTHWYIQAAPQLAAVGALLLETAEGDAP